MSLAYPPPLALDDYTDTAVPDPPADSLPAREVGRSESQGSGKGFKLNTPRYGVLELFLESTLKPGTKSASFTSLEEDRAANHAARFCFAPGAEKVRISWKLKRPEAIRAATLQVFAPGSNVPILNQLLGRAAAELLPPAAVEHAPLPESGYLEWDGRLDRTAPEPYAGKWLQVRSGAYKMKLTVHGQGAGKVDKREAWTYFDVRVKKIEMDWGDPQAILPQARPDVDPKHAPKILRFEKEIFDELKKANARPGAGQKHDVFLTANLFAKKNPGDMETEELKNQTDFIEYRKLWGQGTRIPLLARVFLEGSDGNPTDKAKGALADTRMLWDWDDPMPTRWQNYLGPKATARTKEFLKATFGLHNPKLKPVGSCNCPVAFGGKLGDPAPAAQVFPAQDGQGPFKFVVDPARKRTWAALSRFGTGDDACVTGAVLRPSRMAGDQYAVTAYLFLDENWDAEGKIQAPAPLKAEAGTFEVFRRVNLKHLVRDEAKLGVDAAACANTVINLYRTALNMDVRVRKIEIDNNLYKKAIRNGVEQVLLRSNVYTSMQKAPLFLRNLIDYDPPAKSPGVCVKDRKDFYAAVEQNVKDGPLHILDLTNHEAFLSGEEIRGAQSGALGIILNNNSGAPRPKPPYVILLSAGSGEFWEGEQVTGMASKAVGFLQSYRKASCVGHPYTVTPSTGSAFKDAVQIVIDGSKTVNVEFKKHGFSRKLKTVIPESAQAKLRQALLEAAGGKDRNGPLPVEIKGRNNSPNALERIEAFKTFFDELFLEAVIDRQAFVDTLTGKKSTNRLPQWFPTYDDREVVRAVKDMSTNFLLSAFIEEYLKLDDPTYEGITFLHIAGRTNIRDLEVFKKGYLELKVTGAYYGDTLHTRREVGVVYLSTVDPSGPQVFEEAQKSIESIFAHEAAHALYMPHAPVFATGSVIPAQIFDGGHTGGDNCLMNYDIESEHFCGLCMFRLRGWDWKTIPNTVAMDYEYQVTLELGDVEDLFGPVYVDRELAARLQVLGLFNRPLDHPQFQDCLGVTIGHVEKIYPATRGASDAAVAALLKTEIENFIVEGGALPTPGQFAKIRVPGGFNVMFTQNILMQMFPTKADEESPRAVPYNKYMLGADKSQVEQSYYDANAALGKVPLRITVKMRPKGSTQPWASAQPASGVSVYIQLVTPDPLPAFTPIASPAGEQHDVAGGKSFYKQRTAPPLATKPEQYLAAKVYKSTAPTDPQDMNAPGSAGGLKGVNNRIFCIKSGGGFTWLKSGEASGKHKNSAALTTDENGVARVFFAPSRIGGDRYKLKAYVGNPTQDFDGVVNPPDPNRKDVVETGTMVRWRAVRICHYLQVETPAAVNELSPDLQNLSGRACTHDWRQGRVCPQCLLREGALVPIDLKGKITHEYAKSYCELILESDALSPKPLHTHAADILDAAEELLNDFPDLNSAERVLLSPGDSPGFSPLQESLPAAGGSATNFRTTLTSHSPCPGTITIRPGFDADHSTAVLKDSAKDGTLTDLGKVAGVTGTIDYATGDIDVTFPAAQPGKTWVVYYKPNNVVDVRGLVVFPNKSPHLFQLRLPADYNAAVRTGYPRIPDPAAADPTKPGYPLHGGFRVTVTNRQGKLGDGIVLALLTTAATRGIEKNRGFMPGLILFQAALMDTYSAGWTDGTQEGKGVEQGIYVFGGASFRPSDPGLPQDVSLRSSNTLDTLALHEMSHGIYLQHAPTHSGGKNPGGAKPALHDPADVCVMSYDPVDGDHCGHCVALLRGMKL